MTELLTAAQMRAIEAAAIASGEVTGLELMERAGRGTVDAILAEWPELAEGPRRAVVLCGPGNNGGDGFVVARLLHERGWAVEVFLYGEAGRLPPDAQANWKRWSAVGEVFSFDSFPQMSFWASDIVVDALFGIGLSRSIEAPLSEKMRDLHADGDLFPEQPPTPRYVSLDVPSGFCANSGRLLGPVMPSHLIVAYHRLKVGHYLSVLGHFGLSLRRVDLELSSSTAQGGPWSIVRRIGPPTERHTHSACSEATWLGKDRTSRRPNGIERDFATLHKYDHGHALVLTGRIGRGGAARLTARGALRIGAGLVTLGCPPSALLENASRVDAIMTRPVRWGEGLAEMLSDDRINALALGPGLGTGGDEAALVRAALTMGVLEDPRRAVVLDADALTILAADPDLFALLHDRCVLTPHAGEFARLFRDIAERLDAPAETGPAYSKVDAARDAAARAGCVVIFKGPDTVIAAPCGRAAVNSAHYERSAPWLATAGSGDVLAGFVAGLLARGLAPMRAAEAAAWLHVECALEFGPGLIAEDLPEQLPAVFRRLGV